ncbi:hypothetical protein Mrad2831_2582 [Methylobacterium radiotolerans JCM 2831]|uniref:Protein of unassigned function n=2 Tax=Methylobacterium TaxID=407 RepID=A0A089NY47_9HYPH|nr:hypothetical protein Mrad2831_2582 [Methylobacterium radiotolerans JCM 2831]AIQ90748.1 protein of unassigned function [Methylobacterium oryzae CBMB20]
MIVCSCNVLSADAVRTCAAGKVGLPCTPAAVYRELGCRARCGRCARTIRSIISEAACQRPGCQLRDCAPAPVPDPDSWMAQGSLASTAIKERFDLDQGSPALGV